MPKTSDWLLADAELDAVFNAAEVDEEVIDAEVSMVIIVIGMALTNIGKGHRKAPQSASKH